MAVFVLLFVVKPWVSQNFLKSLLKTCKFESCVLLVGMLRKQYGKYAY